MLRIVCKIMGNLDTKEGKEAYPFIKSMIPWTEKIYDMTDEEIKQYKSAFDEEYHNSEEKHTREVIDVFYMEYQYYQVRKNWNWVLEQYKLSGDKMAIRREILLQRLRGSTESPISPEDLEFLISNMKKSDNDLLINGKWRFRLYEHGAGLRMGKPKDLDEDIPYLVGIDPSGGGGGDNFAITIVNPYNLKIAAEFKSPYISGPAAVKMLMELVTVYIPQAVLIPEKNSMGIYLIQMLVETPLKDRIYWSESQNQIDEITEEDPSTNELRRLAMQYKKYGTYLTGKVRSAMIELLFQYIAECKELINTEYLVDDICKLVRTSTGRIEAAKGEHDDSLMSWLHTIYIYQTGDNLEHFGIHKSDIPGIGPSKIDLSKLEEKEREIQSMFFSTDQVTFDDVVMEDAAMMESNIKEMVDKLSFVHDDVYSKNKDDYNPITDNNVNISSSFFDSINDF